MKLRLRFRSATPRRFQRRADLSMETLLLAFTVFASVAAVSLWLIER